MENTLTAVSWRRLLVGIAWRSRVVMRILVGQTQATSFRQSGRRRAVGNAGSERLVLLVTARHTQPRSFRQCGRRRAVWRTLPWKLPSGGRQPAWLDSVSANLKRNNKIRHAITVRKGAKQLCAQHIAHRSCKKKLHVWWLSWVTCRSCRLATLLGCVIDEPLSDDESSTAAKRRSTITKSKHKQVNWL